MNEDFALRRSLLNEFQNFWEVALQVAAWKVWQMDLQVLERLRERVRHFFRYVNDMGNTCL